MSRCHLLGHTGRCARCLGADETLLYTIRDCLQARRIWHGIGFVLPSQIFTMARFRDILSMFHGFSLIIVLATSWIIWKARCRFIFTGSAQLAHYVVREARSLWVLIDDVYHHSASPPVEHWVR